MTIIRDALEKDLPVFFEQQLDVDANLMAAFPSRDMETFINHWMTKIINNNSVIAKAIIIDKNIAGNILCWEQAGKRLVGYWIGKEFWGKGIGTKALKEFLGYIDVRPLYAHVAKHNIASIKVLEKCGFKSYAVATIFSDVHGHEIEEILFVHLNDVQSKG